MNKVAREVAASQVIPCRSEPRSMWDIGIPRQLAHAFDFHPTDCF
jgi:hypothetical protein